MYLCYTENNYLQNINLHKKNHMNNMGKTFKNQNEDQL